MSEQPGGLERSGADEDAVRAPQIAAPETVEVRRGMFGPTGTGDTSGYGGLVHSVQMPGLPPDVDSPFAALAGELASALPTYERAVAFAKSLGKITSNAEDFPAFIVNRVLVPMINEAIYTLYEGVGTVDAIDTAMKLGANHPMGPLELGDFIGLDTVLSIMNVLYEGLADSKYRPCPLLVKYVEAGWLGKKAGRGFYDYRGAKPVPTR